MTQAAQSAESAAAVRTEGLTRSFGKKLAVNGISLAVPPGSFFGFLGPNGAGKTTTLRMLTGLLPPSAGDAWVGGHSILSEPVAVKRRIGVVPDDLALFERLSFWEHVTLIGRVFDLSRAETEARGEDLLRLLDLWEERGTYVVDASHGMRKKLALAIALIHTPQVLFLDEPFEGIDPIAGKHIRALLARLAEGGVTIFLTSHILEIVERLADQVAIIAKGEIALQASLEDLRRSGRTLEDAFIEAVGAPTDETPELSWLA